MQARAGMCKCVQAWGGVCRLACMHVHVHVCTCVHVCMCVPCTSATYSNCCSIMVAKAKHRGCYSQALLQHHVCVIIIAAAFAD